MTTPTSYGSLDSPDTQAAAVPEQRGPGVDKNALLAWCMKQYTACKQDRVSVEKQWYLNMAFYFGKQNVTVMNTTASTGGFRLTVPPAPPYRVRLVVNKIRPAIRTTLAKVTGQKPRFTVVPATSEDQDQASARVAEAIFDSIYSTHKIHRVIRRATWWTLVCGTSFIKDFWDKDEFDEYSQQPGNIVIEHVSPFHLYVPDHREEELENQPFVIHATMKDAELITATYGINTPTTKGTDLILEDSFLNMVGGQTATKDQVLMLEFWIKPGKTKLLPEGGIVTIVGNQIVQVSEAYPYQHGEFPFTKLEAMPTGRFYGESFITDMIPLQREYNRTRSQIIEAKNLMAKPKLLAAKGSINPNQITSEPGQAILYQPGFPAPVQMQMVPLPPHVVQEVQQLQQDMDDMSGVHDITRGQNPTQVTAATALSFLQEQDDTKLSDAVTSLEDGIEKIGRHVLSHASQYWQTARMVRVVGTDGSFDAQQYKGAAIGGNLDVRVESGSALPQSKAAKQAFVMDLIKMGVVPPEEALKMLDIGGMEKIYEDHLVDVRHAQRENTKMSQGEPVEPNEFDNHEIHMLTHNKFRKTQEFEQLPDEIKAIFETHVQLHMMRLGIVPGLPPQMQPGGPMDPSMQQDPNAQDPNQSAGGPPVGAPQ